MFKTQVNTQTPARQKNLAESAFTEKVSLENIIDELTHANTDPYSASLPLIASAELGDKKRYDITLTHMLNSLDKNTQDHPFKAWMLGRILLAADDMNDADTIKKARQKLNEYLNEDSSAFSAWAWGYRAALDSKNYALYKKSMLDAAETLTKKYQTSPNHEALSNALWAWVMNLQAAAFAGDQKSYHWIKEQIKLIAEENSVSLSLKKGLLRTAQSNDYPAWAMAKTRYSAIIINDKELYQEIEIPLMTSIDSAQKENIKAEYVLSVLDNQLAIFANQNLSFEAIHQLMIPPVTPKKHSIGFNPWEDEKINNDNNTNSSSSLKL